MGQVGAFQVKSNLDCRTHQCRRIRYSVSRASPHHLVKRGTHNQHRRADDPHTLTGLRRRENGWKKDRGSSDRIHRNSLVVTRGQPLSLGSSELAGDILILATAVTIALVFVLSKRIVERRGGRPVTGALLLTTSILLLPTILLHVGHPANLTMTAWFYISYLAVFATLGAYYYFMKGLETVSPTVSSIILPIEVVVAVALSVILFNDPFDLFSGTGALLIIAGVVLVSTAA